MDLGIKYWSHLQESRSMTLEYGENILSRNVGNPLPTTRNIPEEPRSYLHRIEKVKYRHSRIGLYLLCKYSRCVIVI